MAQSFFYTAGTDPDQSLTATFQPASKNAPWVVAIHGGSWSSGTQRNVQPAVDAFTNAGFQVFNLSYRLIADTDASSGAASVEWSAQKQDVLDAISWIRSHAATFGIDRNRGAVWGFSAGGHLAAVAGLSGDGDNGIRAIVSNSGVLAPEELFEDVAGTRDDGAVTDSMRSVAEWEAVANGCPLASRKGTCAQRWTAFDPASYISPHDPAMMIYQGAADQVVPYQGAEAFQHKLAAAHIPTSLVLVPKLGHDWHASLDGKTRQAAMIKWVQQRTAVDVAPSTSTMTGKLSSPTVTNAQTTTLSVAVSSANGTSGGAVTVTSGSYRATALLNAGSASVRVPAMSPGTHPISLAYSGTSVTQTASASVALHVTRVTPVVYTATTAKSLRAGHTRGTKLVLTVHAPAGLTSPAMMTVTSGKTIVGNVHVVAGRSSISLPSLGAGKHYWVAHYSGTTTVAGLKKPFVLTVGR